MSENRGFAVGHAGLSAFYVVLGLWPGGRHHDEWLALSMGGAVLFGLFSLHYSLRRPPQRRRSRLI